MASKQRHAARRVARRAKSTDHSKRPKRSVDVLDAAIIDDPDDEATWLVFADALTEAGDPRGQLVVTQHALAREPADRRLVKLEATLRASLEPTGPFPIETRWRLGYVERLAMDVSQVTDDDAIRAVLDHPSCRFVTELALQLREEDDTGVSVLAERTHPALRSLQLEGGEGDQYAGHDEATDELWSKLPRLETARLRCERALFSEIVHDKLAALELALFPMGDEWTWKLPTLEKLVWKPDDYSDLSRDPELASLGDIWTQHLPALRTFAMHGGLTADPELLERASFRRFIKGLHTLAMPSRAFVEEDAELPDLLVANARLFVHLEQLVIELDDGEGDFEQAQKKLSCLQLI